MDLPDDLLNLIDLLDGMDDEDVAELVRGLPEQSIESLITATTPPRAAPDSPMAQAQEIDEGYRARDHLVYLSDRLAAAVKDVEAGQSRFLVVSMPPRLGKSQQASVYLPLWLLRTHPDWKIGMISHSPTLAVSWGRQVRRMIEEHGDLLGVTIAKDAGAASEWQTTEKGGIVSRSAPGQSITGLGFKVMLIDDAVKDFAAAHSEVQREALWDWWLANAQTRLEPPALVVVIGCLTADTPVLMSDGTECLISEVRPGDSVVTYDRGRFTEGTVSNWANMGPDHVYSVTMASGRVLRANAKHPFLTVDENGVESWTRTDSLAPGSVIRAIGDAGEGSPAPRRGAASRSVVKASAGPTTTKHAGQQATTGRLPSSTDERTSATDTGSSPRSTTGCSTPKTVYVRSVSGLLLPRTHVGRESCSWTTAMTGVECGDSCATTATSSSDTEPRSNASSPLPSTYATDEVVSVEVTGYEDVFDIEVEGTHTFVANGLITHNTRWHEDDLIGRLLSPDHEGDPAVWEVVELPAIAQEHDPLGRTPGEPLLSPLLDESTEEALARWQEVRASVGSYTWNALYQQRPSSAKGAIFDTGWWRFWTSIPEKATEDGKVVYLDPAEHSNGRWLDSWDMAFKGKDDSDYVVGQRWLRVGPDKYLIAQTRARLSFTRTVAEMQTWADRTQQHPPHSRFVHERLVEDKANGTAVIDVLRKEIPGLIPINPTESKQARARAVTPQVEAGNVLLPLPSDPGNEWVTDLLSELREFPTGAHDDQVDAMTQALMRLREGGRGSVVSPNQIAPGSVPRMGQMSIINTRLPGR